MKEIEEKKTEQLEFDYDNFKLIDMYSDYGDITGIQTIKRFIQHVNKHFGKLNESIMEFIRFYNALADVTDEFNAFFIAWEEFQISNGEFVEEVRQVMEDWIDDPRLVTLINDTLGTSKLDKSAFESYKSTQATAMNLKADKLQVESDLNKKLDATVFTPYITKINNKLDKSVFEAYKLTDRTISTSAFPDISPQEVIDNAPEHSHVHIDVPSGKLTLKVKKALKLTFKEGAVYTPADSEKYVLEISGSIASTSTLSKKVTRGDTEISVITNAKVGDMISITGSETRITDGLPDINCEMFTVIANEGGKITLDRPVETDKGIKSGGFTLYNALEHVEVGKINIAGDKALKGTFKNGGMFIEMARHITVHEVNTKFTERSAFSIGKSMHATVGKIHCENGLSNHIGGEGYGCIISFSFDVSIKTVYGYKMRHSFDNNGSYNINVGNISSYANQGVDVLLAHNSYGGNLHFDKIFLDGGSISYSNQSFTDGTDAWARNIRVNNLIIKQTSHLYGISFQVNTDNVSFGSVRIDGSSSSGQRALILFTKYLDVTIEKLNISGFDEPIYFGGGSPTTSGALKINQLILGDGVKRLIYISVTVAKVFIDNIIGRSVLVLVHGASGGNIIDLKIHGTLTHVGKIANTDTDIDYTDLKIILPKTEYTEVNKDGHLSIIDSFKTNGVTAIKTNADSAITLRGTWVFYEEIDGMRHTVINVGSEFIRIRKETINSTVDLDILPNESYDFVCVNRKWYLVK